MKNIILELNDKTIIDILKKSEIKGFSIVQKLNKKLSLELSSSSSNLIELYNSLENSSNIVKKIIINEDVLFENTTDLPSICELELSSVGNITGNKYSEMILNANVILPLIKESD